MKKNNLKTRLKNGEICIGAFSNIHHESLIELSGIAGLDFIIIDAEHSAVTPQVAEQLFRAAELRDLPTVTRIGEIHPQVIQKYLDAGCQGVLMPMVNTAEEAKIVVDSVKYPPLGKRGLAGARSSDYGLFYTLSFDGFDDCETSDNDEVDSDEEDEGSSYFLAYF